MGIRNNFFFNEKYNCKDLPFIRLKKVELKDFKNVKHGEIVFNCGRQFTPDDISSDILGLYGQNGSGKTSLIEALSIVKNLLSGVAVPDIYADCISVDADSSYLMFSFDLQYADGEVRELQYSFKMGKVQLSAEELYDRYKDAPSGFHIPKDGYRVLIFDEEVKLSWMESGKKKILQTIIDASTENIPFGPMPKLMSLIGKKKRSIVDLEVSKKLALVQSRSFVFSKETFKLFNESDDYSVFFECLLEMKCFASLYFFVMDTKSSGFIRLNCALPIYTRYGLLDLKVNHADTLSDQEYEDINNHLKGLSSVLTQLIPGLSIELKKVSDTILSDDNHGNVVMLMANRDGLEFPLRDESDGIRKLISELSLLIAVFNDQSFTLAIDEFDAGVFEYLLGEILQAFQESGKGQFIFTSHNLRPLEVIDKKYLVFTTTNPENRYIKLKGISPSNNLRDTYFREIILGAHDEEIYNNTKRFKIVSAIRKAGTET